MRQADNPNRRRALGAGVAAAGALVAAAEGVTGTLA